jgi:hypothetical protein
MNEGLNLLSGIGLGACLAYFFDPEAGPRRRAQLRDQFAGVFNRTNEGVETTGNEGAHGRDGLESEIRSWMTDESSSGSTGIERLNFFEENWTSTTRVVAGSVGCALMANCLARRTPLAALLGTVGFGLFVRSYANRRLVQLLEMVGRQELPGGAGYREASRHEGAEDGSGPGI